MTDSDERSQRVWDQLKRNRIMDQMADLARGNARVYRMGPWDYFECFFDWFPYEGPWEPNPSMSADEVEACREVLAAMQAALAATPKRVELDELVETGWPERIRPLAERAVRILLARGRFDEDREEAEPSR